MIKLKIIYSQEYDIQRVKNIISLLDWFVENKYEYKKFPFPKALDKEKLKNYSEKEIKNAVIAEYNDDSYKDNEKFLINNWDKISKELKSAFLKSSLSIQEEYTIYFTKYGTSGSYNLPNTIVVNIGVSFMFGMIKTIIHEITHLSIQKYIDEYKIGQYQKERIVDLFFIKNFPRRIFMQKMPIDTEKIDQIFDDKYPNIKEVIKNISEK
jgi:hypothetical protein